jgi:hypothetical protein
MKSFISIKTVLAKPMTLGEYNIYRGWTIPQDEDPNREGYLVEYPNSPSTTHPNHQNYISWSPKEQFDTTHHEVGDKAKTIETALKGQLSVILAEHKAKERQEAPGDFYCPQRPPNSERYTLLGKDHWRDYNTCSYCGSFNPDEFMRGLELGELRLGPTDKNYKVYIHTPGGEQKKFYFEHLSTDQKKRFVELYNEKKLSFYMNSNFYVLPYFMVIAPTDPNHPA